MGLGIRRVSFPPRGIVLFLGGDLFYARLLKRRSGYPLWVYDGYPRYLRGVDVYFARFREDFLAVSSPRKVFLGDLLRSSVDRSCTSLSLPPGTPRFLFLPGSRLFAYPYLLPFFVQCAQALSKHFPRGIFLIAFPGHCTPKDVPFFKELSNIFFPFFGETSSLIASADVIVTVPGSNNLEILYRRKRGLVLVPFWKDGVEKVPVMGIVDILGRIPLWGRIIKRAVLKRVVFSSDFVSLPNRILGREVLPELRGDITVEEVVRGVMELLQRKVPDFPEEDFPRGAAKRLVELLTEEFYGQR